MVESKFRDTCFQTKQDKKLTLITSEILRAFLKRVKEGSACFIFSQHMHMCSFVSQYCWNIFFSNEITLNFIFKSFVPLKLLSRGVDCCGIWPISPFVFPFEKRFPFPTLEPRLSLGTSKNSAKLSTSYFPSNHSDFQHLWKPKCHQININEKNHYYHFVFFL